MCVKRKKISDEHGNLEEMINGFEYFEEVSKKLTDISDLLEKILVEQQRANLAFENIGEEMLFKEEFVVSELSEVNAYSLSEKNILFLGFRKQDVKQFVNQIVPNVRYIPSVEREGDFAAVVTNCNDNDLLLFNCDGITKSQTLLNLITDTIDDGKLDMQIGKGSSARYVTLDLPKINYAFFETTSFLVPKVLRDAVDCCIWNKNDKIKG